MHLNKKEIIKDIIRQELDSIFETTKYLYENPEIGHEEVKSAKRLCEEFRRYGFTVEEGICGMPTAFQAVLDSGKPGVSVGFCAEYDALPEIGHGCGHNLIATMALGAAVGLSAVLQKTGGRIVVFGTPAEETSGGKVAMTEGGVFSQVDVAMMAHPAALTEESGGSLALNALCFRFFGKTAHAAAAPEMGINALAAVIQLFNGIDALRQHLPRSVMIHGIISNGGAAPNVVPDFAEAKFYIRAPKKAILQEAVKRVKAVAEGAAAMTGASVEIFNYEASYDDMNTNNVLNRVVCSNLESLGDAARHSQRSGGSLDMGNVSYVVPSVHMWIGFGKPDLVSHTREFTEMTVAAEGRKVLYNGACALALSGYDVMTQPELLHGIQREFKQAVRGL